LLRFANDTRPSQQLHRTNGCRLADACAHFVQERRELIDELRVELERTLHSRSRLQIDVRIHLAAPQPGCEQLSGYVVEPSQLLGKAQSNPQLNMIEGVELSRRGTAGS